jgi:glycosyltransferase involved in cell wall biosynthesis
MNKENVKVLVCQRGARRRYAVPRLLEEAGMLAGLYTDSCALSTLGKIANLGSKVGITHAKIRALAARKPLGIPKDKIFASDRLFYSSFLAKSDAPLAHADALAQVYKSWGTQGANVVYSMNTADYPFLRFVKDKGLKVVVDVYVSPLTEEIIYEECRKFSQTGVYTADFKEEMKKRYIEVFKLADIILCPSKWVAEGCIKLTPEYADKIRLCPYGSSISFADEPKLVAENDVLFAGRDPIRKGVHYLAEAAVLLRSKKPNLKVRIAGLSSEQCAWIESPEQLIFLGHVPMTQMRQLFATSSVFVLPSLSEGQAGVVIEALAMGCPVVVTRECGVDIEDGKQGFIVPAGDSDAIALRVSDIINDTNLFREMSANALEFARSFSVESWKQRLVDLCSI